MIKKTGLLFICLFIPLFAGAASIDIGNGYFLKAAEKTQGDIYVASDNALFSGFVSGDAFAAARAITSDGEIDEDALFAGETVVVSGTVRDDLRIIGGTVRIQGSVSGDVVALGADISLAPEATIAGNLYAAGGKIIIGGKISGEAKAAGGSVELSGSVGGSLEAWGDKISLSSGASIGGDFIYHGPSEALVASETSIGGETLFDKWKKERSVFARFSSGFLPLHLLMGLASAFFLFLLFRERTEEVLLDAFENFWRRLLRGFLLLILLPIGCAVLFFTFVGIPFGIAFLAVYFAGLIFAAAYAGMLLGAILERPLFRRSAFPLSARTIFVGVALLALLGMVPYLGSVAALLLTLASFGAIGTIGWKNLKNR